MPPERGHALIVVAGLIGAQRTGGALAGRRRRPFRRPIAPRRRRQRPRWGRAPAPGRPDPAALADNPILFPTDAIKRRLYTWGGLAAADEDELETRFAALTG